MSSPNTKIKFTYRDYKGLPESEVKRYELLEGEKRMQVPLLDLKPQYEQIKKEVEEAVKEVLRSGYYILGPNVKALEEEMAAYCGTKYAVGVASGTDALRLSLISLGISEGDEVTTAPFTFVATTEAIVQVGAKPVFVDIEEETFNIDPAKIEEAITEKTRAIIPVHLYGQAVNIEPIMRIAKKYSLKVIEDAAQAIGAEYGLKKVGSIGDVGCLSFFPTKNLGGCGDGGMVLTNDEKIAEKIKSLRIHGTKSDYIYSVFGYNSRLDELQAAILRVKLKYLDKWIEMRRQKAFLYNELFSSSPSGPSKGVKIPQEAPHARHSYCVYTICTPERERLKEYLETKGIRTKVYYPLPLHLQRVHKDLGYRKGDFPLAEKASREVLSLPIYPELERDKIELVVKEISNFFLSAKRGNAHAK